MDAKKIFAIFACAGVAILGVSFAIFPFCEHKINWDVVAAKTVAKAADAGCEDAASELISLIKYKQFAGAANAHMALLKYRKSGAQKANAFIKSCGKDFDFDEYSARLMIEEIAAEPDFAPGFFKLKYLPRIESLKNPYLRAVLYYELSLRIKNADSKKYASQALKILKEQPACEDKTRACVEISEMALANKRPEDFFEFLEICPKNAHCYAALFQFLKDEDFCVYIKGKKANTWIFRAIDFSNDLKKKKNYLKSCRHLKYIVWDLGYNYITRNYVDFNMPLFVYISFAIKNENAFDFYKWRAISDENIKNMEGSHFGYLNNSAIFFLASGDRYAAFTTTNKTNSRHIKLRILNSMLLQLKSGDASPETIENIKSVLYKAQ